MGVNYAKYFNFGAINQIRATTDKLSIWQRRLRDPKQLLHLFTLAATRFSIGANKKTKAICKSARRLLLFLFYLQLFNAICNNVTRNNVLYIS